MSNANTDPIADFIGLTPMSVEKRSTVTLMEPVADDRNAIIEGDIEYARGNIHRLLQDGHSTLEGLFAIAEQAQSGKIYEILTQFIRTMAQTNLDLIELQEKHKRLVNKMPNPTTVNNNLVLSTHDLLKIIKEKRGTGE